MQKKIFWFIIIFANLLFAFIAISDPLRAINSDGVLYLQTAKIYLQSGLHAAMSLYPWPFYSVLIAWMSQFFHCSVELAAYFINTIFQIFICLGFFNLACKIRKTQNSNDSLFMMLATLVILFYPAFNHDRDLIIRDFGYWAFSLWGWFYLLCLYEDERCLNGIAFSISMLLSSFFRLEGIVMILCAPFSAFFLSQKPIPKKINIFLKAYGITLIFLTSTIIYFWIYSYTPDNLGRLLDIKTQLYSGIHLITQGLIQAKYNMMIHVLMPAAVDSAGPLLVGGLMGVYIKMLIGTLGGFYTILLFISILKKQDVLSTSAKPVIIIAIILNLLITVIFLTQTLFLTQRYLMGLCFLLLLWLPFTLLWIYEETCLQKPWIFPGVLIVMSLIALVSLHNFGASKAYLKEASHWIHENLPRHGLIYTNSPQLGFYISRSDVVWQDNASIVDFDGVMRDARLKGYNYLVFQVKSDNSILKNQLNHMACHPLKVFVNKQGDAVLVFKFSGCRP